MIVAPPDRSTIAAAVMDDLLAVEVAVDDERVGVARIVATADVIVAGAPVVREITSRVGVRTRSLVDEGQPAAAGTPVVELGGPVAAIRAVAPLALTWLVRCGALASGATPPEAGNPIDAYAARLSARGAVGHDEPSFRLEIDPHRDEGIRG
jgi:Quinolinate phosphoribosyl transferase, N-terminal domain